MKQKFMIGLVGLFLTCSLQAQGNSITFAAGPGLGLAIPDDGYNGTQGSMACSSINVPNGSTGSIGFVSVETRIDHFYVGDLTLKLYPPTGGFITLVSRPGLSEIADNGSEIGGDDSNLAAVTPISFQDENPNTIPVNASANFNLGFFPSAETMGANLGTAEVIGDPTNSSPATYGSDPGATSGVSLLSLRGLDSTGTWTLCVGDSATADSGDLDGWSLTVNWETGNCDQGEFNLCLLKDYLGADERFRITMEYQAVDQGPFLSGRATGISNQAGFFYFTNPANMEILVKMIDACSFSNSYWLFISGLTDRGIKVKVEDLFGISQTYSNPLGTNFVLVKDFTTFGCGV